MARRRRYNEDNSDMLADGQIGRVRMTMRDSRSVNDAAHRYFSRDLRVLPGSGLAEDMNRPGFRTHFNDEAAAEKQRAYDSYEYDLQNAWRDDSGVNGAGEHGARGAQEGDVCTCRGAEYPEHFGEPGHLVRQNGKLICKPDRLNGSDDDPDRATSDGLTTMDDLYAQYDFELANRWRQP